METFAKNQNARNVRGDFGIIRSIKSIRALIGSRETWKFLLYESAKKGVCPLGRVSFRVSYRAFQGLS